VKEFVKMGWEIASHSRYHRHDRTTNGPWTKLTVKELHEEIIDSKKDIMKNLGIEPYTMVAPGVTTAQNPLTLREIRLICRQYAALSLSSNLKVFNRLGRNPYNLWAIPIHWSTGIFTKVEKITRISKNKAFWVIFYIHKISNDLSDPLTSMKPSQLKALVEILAADEDLNVVTIKEGVELGHLDRKGQGR
jgi:peptidoglycan/xylan/chitin deacetylase (PgdA/CDA1 family)